jgi:hypothetical protein
VNDAIREHLDAEDNPELWRVVLDSVLSDLRAAAGMTVEVGRWPARNLGNRTPCQGAG